jgi:hypothetical protein
MGGAPRTKIMRITNRRGPIMALFVAVVAAIVGQWIPTEVIAFRLGFAPWLGTTIVPGVYMPFAWPVWWWRWYQPVPHLLQQPIRNYGDAAAAAFATLPWTLAATGVFIAVVYIVALIVAKRSVDDIEDLYDPGGRWSTLADAQRLGMLKAAGPIIGAGPMDGEGRVETKIGWVKLTRDGMLPLWARVLGAKMRYLRAPFENGLIFTDPPGGGKSATIQSWLAVPLQDARARRVKFSVFDTIAAFVLQLTGNAEAARSHRRWSDLEKRVDPWGEEPLVFITDLKGEFSVKSSAYQHDNLGKRTEVLAPVGLPETFTDVDGTEAPYPIASRLLACYNPFWSARVGTESGYQNLYGKVKAIVERMTEEQQSHWDLAAEGWGTSVLEHLAYVALNTGNFAMFSPCGLMSYLSAFREKEEDNGTDASGNKKTKKVSAMDVLLRDMKTYEHDRTPEMSFKWERTRPDGTMERARTKPSIHDAADAMLAKDVKERTSVWSSFLEKLNLFRSDVMRKYTSTSTFEWKQLANAKNSATVYYVTPAVFDMADIEIYSAMVIDDLLRDLTYGGTPTIKGRSVRGNKAPALVVLEEAYVVARAIPSLEKIAGVIRGYALRLGIILQSAAQSNKMFGKGGEMNALAETLDTHLYGATKLPENASAIQTNLGFKTKALVAENRSGDVYGATPLGHMSEQLNTSKEPLMTAKEITQMDPSECIGIVKGFNFRMRRAQFFLNAWLERRALKAPKISALNTVSEPFFVRSVRSVIGDEAFAHIKAAWTAGGANEGGATAAAAAGVTIEHPVRVTLCSGAFVRVTARNIGEAVYLASEAIAEADAAAASETNAGGTAAEEAA